MSKDVSEAWESSAGSSLDSSGSAEVLTYHLSQVEGVGLSPPAVRLACSWPERCWFFFYSWTCPRLVLACLKWTQPEPVCETEPGPPEAAGPSRLSHGPLEARVLKRGFEQRGDTRSFVLGLSSTLTPPEFLVG